VGGGQTLMGDRKWIGLPQGSLPAPGLKIAMAALSRTV